MSLAKRHAKMTLRIHAQRVATLSEYLAVGLTEIHRVSKVYRKELMTLTMKDLVRIVRLLRKKRASDVQIAKQYHVSPSTVSRIGQRWNLDETGKSAIPKSGLVGRKEAISMIETAWRTVKLGDSGNNTKSGSLRPNDKRGVRA